MHMVYTIYYTYYNYQSISKSNLFIKLVFTVFIYIYRLYTFHDFISTINPNHTINYWEFHFEKPLPASLSFGNDNRFRFRLLYRPISVSKSYTILSLRSIHLKAFDTHFREMPEQDLLIITGHARD